MSASRLRLLHTADWHLGHTLHEQPRDEEHRAFLDWLVERLAAESVDALVVSGDVFDTANPSAAAQAAWFRFLAAARRAVPWLRTVVVAGNHDSPGRLAAPAPALDALGVTVVGLVSRNGDGVDAERLLVPLTARDGAVAAWVAAVPYLRTADAGGVTEPGEEPGADLAAGVRRLYGGVLDAARARRRPGQALVATGHLYLAGAQLSALSERRILGGGLHALPHDLFPPDVTYAALGHLHRAQRVGGRDEVRYSGSPIPLALDEGENDHQVVLVDVERGSLAGVRALRVPRRVGILRVPAREPEPLERVLALLRALPETAGTSGPRPYLEVRVLLDTPEPFLEARIGEALEGKAARLVKVTATRSGTGTALAGEPSADLSDLGPDEVFRRRYARDHEGEPSGVLWAAFRELVEEAERGEEAR